MTPEQTPPDHFDVVIVGGGPAGLAAATTLARSRRRVVVLDDGHPRNATATGVHNLLGREGTSPADLLATGRAEAEAYGVEVRDVLATRTETRTGILGFTVTTTAGPVHGRRLLVATGSLDPLPDLPGLADRWGRDVLHCPFCHGWEVRDRRLAVIASAPFATHQALLFRALSDHVVMLLDEGVELSDSDQERLGARGVDVRPDPAAEVLVTDDRLTGLRLASGTVLDLDAVVVGVRPQARVDWLAPAGPVAVPFEAQGQVFGTVLDAAPTGETTTRGVYVVGNAADVSATVAVSAARGVSVGGAIHQDLVSEEADAAVAAQRAAFFEAPAWEERYSGATKIWSGRPNPQLEAEVRPLAPGRALDLGSGEGGDVVWLAQQGWQVTGIDFAEAALARGATHAEQAGVGERAEWRQGDARTWEPGAERWDLVTSQYLHLPDGGMVGVVRRMARAVAPGGVLLVVGHHPDDLHTGLRHGSHSFMFVPEDLLPALDHDEWRVEVAESRPRTVEHDGRTVEIADSVLVARRR